jgi:hypothetical protein
MTIILAVTGLEFKITERTNPLILSSCHYTTYYMPSIIWLSLFYIIAFDPRYYQGFNSLFKSI